LGPRNENKVFFYLKELLIKKRKNQDDLSQNFFYSFFHDHRKSALYTSNEEIAYISQMNNKEKFCVQKMNLYFTF